MPKIGPERLPCLADSRERERGPNLAWVASDRTPWSSNSSNWSEQEKWST